MKKLSLIAVLLLTAAAAQAGTTACTHGGGVVTCTQSDGSGGSNARIVHRDQLDLPDPIREAAWLAWCQPLKQVDTHGVTRLAYKHPGCEYGMTGPADIAAPKPY